MNEDILKIMQKIIDNCVSASFDALACKWVDNPGVHKLAEILDETADDLRALQDELKKE